MNIQAIHPFILPLMLAALVSGATGVYSWRQPTAGSRLFSGMNLMVSLWSVAYGMELLQSTLGDILFWIRIEYLAISSGPVFLFLFATVYTDSGSWARTRRAALLFAVPALVILLVWSNPWHNLHYINPQPVTESGFTFLSFKPGISYWINVTYSYLMIGASIWQFFHAYITSGALYRRQIGTVLAGVLIPWLGNILYVFVFRPGSRVDLTPITFSISTTIMAIGIYRYQLLALAPIARSELVELTQDAWIVLDTPGRLVDLNATATMLLDKPKDALIGKHAGDSLPTDHPLLPCLTATGALHTEVTLDNITGGPQTMDARLTLLTDRRQRTTGRLLVLRDVTERRRAEAALRVLNRQLESTVEARTAEINVEKEKVEAILTSVNEGILLISPELIVEYVNSGLVRLANEGADDLLGLPIEQLAIWHLPPPWTHVKLALARKGCWEGDGVIYDGRGGTIPCALFASPVSDGNERVKGYIVTVRDISELKQLDAARSQFIANISHELRTPITNLKLYLGLLERPLPEEKRRHYAEILQVQAERLEDLAQSVVDLARLESSYSPNDWRTIDAAPLLHNAIATVEPVLRKRRVRVAVDASDAPAGQLNGDPDLIQRAFVELITNAALYAPEESNIRVTGGAEFGPEGRMWTTFTVADKGPGISAAEREMIFDRFFRGEAVSSQTTPGFGLGLSVVREIMKAHEGRVSLVAQEGEGSAFTLWFPAVPAD